MTRLSRIVVAALVAAACSPAVFLPAQDGTRPRTKGERFGDREPRVHDPSTIVKDGDEYWIFATGMGVASLRSKDLVNWERGPAVFSEPPEWITDVVPTQRGHFWAPDVIHHGGRYLLYYSVSAFGKQTSAIALATNVTLDPEDLGYTWKDEGMVIRSDETVDYNAIDPAVVRSDDGTLWMAFGSFWTGIKLIELDPRTGKRIAGNSPVYDLAHKEQIEAVALYRHGDYWYQFVNWGWCCRGVNSTYNIRVGRSRAITGPYVDRQGVDLREGGGTLLLETEGTMIGPGHAGLYEDGERLLMSYHFYDGTQRGRPRLAIRPLQWGDGWPRVAGPPIVPPARPGSE